MRNEVSWHPEKDLPIVSIEETKRGFFLSFEGDLVPHTISVTKNELLCLFALLRKRFGLPDDKKEP